MNWLFLDTGARPGAWNMEVDEALARSFRALGGTPILRLFAWQPHAISLGAHQDPGEFDLARIRADGIDIVRRPTGGRAIFHAHELTYSVVLDAADRGARDVYRYLSEGILRALIVLGIPAAVAGDDEKLAAPRDTPLAIPCFSVATRSEIQVEGKKIVGNAQRRYDDIILQHGSFLLGAEHRRLASYLAPHLRETRSAVEDRLSDHTTEAESVLGRSVRYEEAAAAFREGFRLAYGCAFRQMTGDELAFCLHTPSTVEQP